MSENMNPEPEVEVLGPALQEIKEALLISVAGVKSAFSIKWRIVLLAIPAITLIIAGMFVGESIFMNIVATVAFFASVIFSVALRYLVYSRSVRIVERFLNGLGRIEEPLEIQTTLLSRFAITPTEVYEAALEFIPDEWLPLIPELEKHLEEEFSEN